MKYQCEIDIRMGSPVGALPKDIDIEESRMEWLMQRFGSAISNELFYPLFQIIVQEFDVNPENIKNLRFTLKVETIDKE